MVGTENFHPKFDEPCPAGTDPVNWREGLERLTIPWLNFGYVVRRDLHRSEKFIRVTRLALTELPSDPPPDMEDSDGLDLSSNSLTALPDWIATFRCLCYLNIGHNQMPGVPEPVRQLKNLVALVADGNPIKELPEWIGELSALEEISMQDTDLENLSPSISSLANLKGLYLRKCSLTRLPEDLDGLKSLEELDLTDNSLRELPLALTRLPNIKRLHLHGN
eukprot:gene51848-63401_t